MLTIDGMRKVLNVYKSAIAAVAVALETRDPEHLSINWSFGYFYVFYHSKK